MLEGLMLAVHIGKKMLGGLRQMQNCLKIDNFGSHTRHGREIACKQTQIAQVLLDLIYCYVLFCHNVSSVYSAGPVVHHHTAYSLLQIYGYFRKLQILY